MQEFKFHGQKIRGCFKAFGTKNNQNSSNPNSLEGFFVWTRDGIYECRPKVFIMFIIFFLLY